MARRPRGSWPGTESEIADRDRIVTLVKRVGKHRLTFTAADLRAEIGQVPWLKLTHSAELWRHLAALDGDLIEEVGRRDFGQQVESGGYRGRKRYVLRSRLVEIPEAGADTIADLDNPERVRMALWVAFLCADSQPVATTAVTRVLKEIEPLTLEKSTHRIRQPGVAEDAFCEPGQPKPVQTHAVLQALQARTPPAVERLRVEGERWVRWRPLGRVPVHDQFGDWLTDYRRSASGDASMAGKSTLNEVGRELIRLTIRARKSTTYPYGQSARLPDVREFAGSTEQGKQLAASIRRRSRSIAAVITDAARGVLAGMDRVAIRIARLRAPLSNRVYYDIPDEPGFEHRVRTIALHDLRHALRDGILQRIEDDMREATALPAEYAAAGPELELLVASRLLLAQREFAGLDDVLRDVETGMARFSLATRQELQDHRALLDQFLSRRPWSGDEEEVFENGCADYGLEPEAILGAPRPMVTPHDYASWFSEDDLGDYTPAEFMALAVPLRRFLNPRYTHRRDTNKSNVYQLTTDRVEALPYAANRLMARSSTPLAAGARLLGRNLRSAALVQCLALSDDSGLRRDALAALVLLDENPAALAAPFLSDPTTPTDTVADTLMLLHLSGSFDPAGLPERIRSTRDWHIGAALREVMLARSQRRRLI